MTPHYHRFHPTQLSVPSSWIKFSVALPRRPSSSLSSPPLNQPSHTWVAKEALGTSSPALDKEVWQESKVAHHQLAQCSSEPRTPPIVRHYPTPFTCRVSAVISPIIIIITLGMTVDEAHPSRSHIATIFILLAYLPWVAVIIKFSLIFT